MSFPKREQPMTTEEIEDIQTLSVHWTSMVRQAIISDLCISHKLLKKELEESETKLRSTRARIAELEEALRLVLALVDFDIHPTKCGCADCCARKVLEKPKENEGAFRGPCGQLGEL